MNKILNLISHVLHMLNLAKSLSRDTKITDSYFRFLLITCNNNLLTLVKFMPLGMSLCETINCESGHCGKMQSLIIDKKL